MAEQLDPRKPHFITVVGKKGSGKSELATAFWDSYPGDRLVIDPTGDVDTHDPKTIALHDPLPVRWPAKFDPEQRRQTLRYVPDMGSATYVHDMDHAAGLAFNHEKCLLYLDEVGDITNANFTPPAMRRILHQCRHARLSVLCAAPRPIDINKLVISQADFIGVFLLPDEDDRKKLAKNMGYSVAEFEEAHDELRGAARKHWYLWYDAGTGELEVRPPIPLAGARAKAEHPKHHDARV